MPQVNIELQDYAKAKDGSLLIKKDGKWVITTFEELNKVNDPIIKKVEELEQRVKLMQKQQKIQQKLLKVLFSFFMWPGFLASYNNSEIYVSSIFCYSIAIVSNFCVLTLVMSTSMKEQELKDKL